MTQCPSPELMFKQWFTMDHSGGSSPPVAYPLLMIAGNAEGLAKFAMQLLDAASSVQYGDIPSSIEVLDCSRLMNQMLSDRMDIMIFKLPADERRSSLERAIGFTPENAMRGDLFETYEKIAEWARQERDADTEPPTE